MREQQNSKPCGGNSFIFSAILLCIFAIVAWLFFLMFQADAKTQLSHRSSISGSGQYSSLAQKKEAQNKVNT
ncbi:MAG: hypothetical protein KAU21_13275, partial [Gammaproteobacteria bacterium]|nr:hypothetical protein [Gammaproteobacteria bacterium]